VNVETSLATTSSLLNTTTEKLGLKFSIL
jgi:hypothetical protein